MRCSNCDKWEILPDDEFCSWCGHDLLGLTLSLDRSQLFFGDGFQTINLTIGYVGKSDAVEIKRVETNRQWVNIKDDEAEGSRIETGSRIEIPFEVNALALAQPDGYHSAEITVVTDIATRRIQVEVNPTPKINVSIGEVTLLLTSSGHSRLTGSLEIKRGAVTVNELTVSVPLWAKVEVVGTRAFRTKIDARRNSRLDFEIVVDEDWLLRDIANNSRPTPAEYRGNLVVEYGEISPPVEYPFYLNCMLPPELLLSEGEQMELDLFFGRPAELVLNVQNGDQTERGRADLEIRNITTNVGWLELSQAQKLPLKIKSGRSVKITFSANADKARDAADSVTEITFLTNVPGEDVDKKVWVRFNVREMPEFRQSLAIDFGTTNSCCAYMDDAGRPALIDVDPALKEGFEAGESPQVVKSAILYTDLLDENQRMYEIGAKSYQMRLEPQAAPSVVTQIKRRLGEEEKEPVTFFLRRSIRRYYKPKEIASDIIHRILERAESQLKGTISHCTIAHPSRFSIRQINELKESLASRGIKEENIETIHEPVAAALDFIQQDEVLEYEEYHLMVFDFGGGTTDITLLHVTNKYDSAKNLHTVTPKLLGATGDRWLGGEDVSDMLAGLFLENCNKYLRSLFPEAAKFSIPFDLSTYNNARLRETAYNNSLNLRRWLEASKIALSVIGDVHVNLLAENLLNATEDERAILRHIPAQTSLGVLIDDQLKMVDVPYKNVVPLIENLNQKLRPRLEEMAKMMRLLAQNNSIAAPDIILLAGGSSAFPIVEEVIASSFPPPVTKIKRPFDLKKCVATGACFMYSEDVPEGVFVNLKRNGSLEATTSRLGMRVRGRSNARFKEIIPAGVPIPANGLRKVLDDLPPIQRRYRLSIIENTGLTDDFVIDGKRNRNIRTLREFHLEQKLSDWETSHNTKISDEALSEAKIEFEVSTSLTARLVARIPGIEEPIEFEPVDVPGY